MCHSIFWLSQLYHNLVSAEKGDMKMDTSPSPIMRKRDEYMFYAFVLSS